MRRLLNNPGRVSFRYSTVVAFICAIVLMVTIIVLLACKVSQLSNAGVIVVTEQI